MQVTKKIIGIPYQIDKTDEHPEWMELCKNTDRNTLTKNALKKLEPFTNLEERASTLYDYIFIMIPIVIIVIIVIINHFHST